MKLIVAQGNPGTEYSQTRHNVGFRLLSSYAHAQQLDFGEKSKFRAYIAEFNRNGEKILLVKPTTYYNQTGMAIRSIVDFYKLDPASDLLVLHDDIALPLGTVRTRERGSDAGNNGIKSLNAHLDENYKRIRIGVGSELSEQMEASAYVLGKLTSEELKILKETVDPLVTKIIDAFINDSFDSTSYK